MDVFTLARLPDTVGGVNAVNCDDSIKINFFLVSLNSVSPSAVRSASELMLCGSR